MADALRLRGFTKRYDDGLLALDAVDLTVGDGEFFGLLGPNGAGKTTLISLVCNHWSPTAGEARVFGHPHDSLKGLRAGRSRGGAWGAGGERTRSCPASGAWRRPCSTTAATSSRRAPTAGSG